MLARVRMAAPFIAPVTAVQVGSYFIEQYYQILHQQPGLVYQFYTDASTVLRVDGAIVQSATAMMQIHSLITSIHVTGIEIRTAHSLESWSGGVLVMVSGFLQAKEYGRRKQFAQTFFLAPQEKGYFVLNDILYFIHEEELHHHPASLLPHGSFDSKLNVPNPLPEAVSEYMLGEELQERDFVSASQRDFVSASHAEENVTVDNYTMHNSSHSVSDANSTLLEESHAEVPPHVPSDIYTVGVNSAAELPPNPVEELPVREPIKQTYASILRVTRNQSGAAPATSQNLPQKGASAFCSEAQGSQSIAPHVNPVSATAFEKSSYEAEEPSAPEEEEETSVYVRNLPLNASASELDQEFKKFGKIKPEGVVIRSRKDVGICYAFIEFEEASGVQNAIKASTVQIAGRQVYIEERRASSTARGGRRGRGRGRIQSDASRGAFSYRGPYRDCVHDAGDFSGRPRGNGFRSRGSQLERGVLGQQASRNGADQYESTA